MSWVFIYLQYTIRSTPQLLESMQWMPAIAINWERDRKKKVRSFSAENIYATEVEADFHGIVYGQQIINGKVPGLSVD